jgi:hypothetical protein
VGPDVLIEDALVGKGRNNSMNDAFGAPDGTADLGNAEIASGSKEQFKDPGDSARRHVRGRLVLLHRLFQYSTEWNTSST